tara:strand:+ start:304 stop:984 length:681 start_codon:yes stop_codon:yes gene_type:complete
MKFGSITTGIIADGLVFNIDPANRASTIPSTSTTTIFNTVDTSISGAFENNTQWEGPTTASFTFDGGDDAIILNSELDLGLNSTVSVWVKQDRPTTGESILGNDISLKYLLHANTDALFVRIGGAYFQFGDGDTKSAYQVTTWINITFTRTSNLCKIYVNGIATEDERSPTVGTATTNTLLKSIGAETDLSYDYMGKVANLQAYNRALSANEVLHNYNALKGRFGL